MFFSLTHQAVLRYERCVRSSKALDVRIEKLLTAVSPEKLADALGVSVATVYRWKAGNVKRPLRSLLRKLDEIEADRAWLREGAAR